MVSLGLYKQLKKIQISVAFTLDVICSHHIGTIEDTFHLVGIETVC